MCKKVECIKPFFPNDCEIIKSTTDNGDVIYHHSSKSELNYDNAIRVMDEELELSLECLLEPFDVIEKALCNSDNIPIANTIALVRQSILNTLFEMFQLIEKQIGTIKITRIYQNEINSFYRWGRCIDVKLLPPGTAEDH